MDLLQIIVLALLQGLTEFLPISSSAHLILVPLATGWPDQGLAFDVAVHLGSLLAVIIYFRHPLRQMSRDWLDSLKGGPVTPDARLGWLALLATIPVGLAGFALEDYVQTELRSPLTIAWATIGFGLVLWWADAAGTRRRNEYGMRWREALLIGLAQVMALIPGASRSGLTLTAGLALGLTPTAAARFSFLLSIPVILLAGGMQVFELVQSRETVHWRALAAAVVLSGLSAFACIHLFLKALERIGVLPFVIYRLLLGVVLLVIFW